MVEKIDVKMGEYEIQESPIIIQSMGIGSCVVICLYDRKRKIGGLAHIMSPRSEMKEDVKPMRFADKAIKKLVQEMNKKGINNRDLIVKIIGGASMFAGTTSIMSIGNDNILAVRKEFKDLGIRILKEDVGGNRGRSVWFDTSNGDVVVSHIGGETSVI